MSDMTKQQCDCGGELRRKRGESAQCYSTCASKAPQQKVVPVSEQESNRRLAEAMGVSGKGGAISSNERIASIRSLLRAPLEQTAPNNQARGWRTDCDYVLTELDDKLRVLDECIPFLRAHAKSCEVCEGSGEIVTGPSDEEATSQPCAHCKPIWDLIERIEPQKQQAEPVVAMEESYDMPF